MFMVLSSWQSRRESSPGSLMNVERHQAAPTPDQARRLRLWVPPVQAARVYTHHRLSPKADTHFTVARRVEGWVDIVGWLHTQMVYPPTDGHPSWY